MLSFSLNQRVDLSGINFDAKTWQGREWLSTLYINAVEGKLGYAPKCNADAYGYGAEVNTKRNMVSTSVPIITSDELEDGNKGVCLELMTEFATEIDKSYEEEEFYKQQFDQFVDMRELIFLEKSVDFAVLVLQAARYVKAAQSKLRELRNEYARLDELISGVLSGATWQSDLRKLAETPIF